MTKKIKIALLYDKETLSGYKGGWGFSLWIEIEGLIILFDSGWNGEIILDNIKKLNFDLKNIDLIFLSHDHWDHIGGVIYLLNQKIKNLKNIIVPSSFSDPFKQQLSLFAPLIEIRRTSQPVKLFPRVWSSGEMGEKIIEHSLVISDNSNRLIVITGCSHPRLDKIIDQSRQIGSVKGVIGGFHGFNNIEILKDLEIIIPLHCTTKKQSILSRYPQTSYTLKVGEKIEL